MIVLPINLQEKISQMAETGMGYHIVTIITNEGQNIKGALVLNGSIVKLPRNVKVTSEQIADIK